MDQASTRLVATFLLAVAAAIAAPLSTAGCGGDDPIADADAAAEDDAEAPVTAFTITPTEVRLGLGEAQAFVASHPATWKVIDSGGGTVDAAGNYRRRGRSASFRWRRRARSIRGRRRPRR